MNYSRGCDAVLGLMGPLSTPSSPTSTGGGGGGGGCSSGSDGYHSDSDSDETKYLPPRPISELIKLAEITLFVLLVLLPFFNAFLFRFSCPLSVLLRLCPAKNHNQLITVANFHSSHLLLLPLISWFWCCWPHSTNDDGCSSSELVRQYTLTYSKNRIDTLDSLNSLPQLKHAHQLKAKILFSIIVVSKTL